MSYMPEYRVGKYKGKFVKYLVKIVGMFLGVGIYPARVLFLVSGNKKAVRGNRTAFGKYNYRSYRSLFTLYILTPVVPFCLITKVILAKRGTVDVVNGKVANGKCGLTEVSFLTSNV